MAHPRRALPLRHMRHLNTSAIFVLSLGSLSGATILMVVARATISRSPCTSGGAGLKRLQQRRLMRCPQRRPDSILVHAQLSLCLRARLTVSPDAGAQLRSRRRPWTRGACATL